MKTLMKTSTATVWLQCLVVLVVMGLCVIPCCSAGFGGGEGCSKFCRATGFAGVVGNCACGLSLFSAKKRSIFPGRYRLRDPFGWQSGESNPDPDSSEQEQTIHPQRVSPLDLITAERRARLKALPGPRLSFLRRK